MKRRIMFSIAAFLLVVLAGGLAMTASAKDSGKKERIDKDAKEVMAKLFEKSPDAKALYNKAYGYAVFTATKVTVGASGGGGRGVAIEKANGKRTYMKMATGGVGVGLGAQRTEYVFLFETKDAFDSFVVRGWGGGAGASAAAGTAGANARTEFKNGVVVFQFSKGGFVASADVSGTRYWKDDDLN
jgi:lipid-binding SYLF domain-containing protein